MPITTHKNNIPFEYPKTINTISQDWLFGHNTFLNIDSHAYNHSPTLVYTSLMFPYQGMFNGRHVYPTTSIENSNK
jgi:hypothetical protein